MLLTAAQIASLADVSGGDDCTVYKLGGSRSAWVRVTPESFVERPDVFISPSGQIHDRAPAGAPDAS